MGAQPLTLAALALMVGSAAADTPARVVSVYDGDSIKVEAEIWPGLTWSGSVRVDGVDTPEIRGKCDAEKAAAVAARDFVAARAGDRVTLYDVQLGKYAGRVVARVQLDDGADLTHALIDAGHGRPYDGGKREGWCP